MKNNRIKYNLLKSIRFMLQKAWKYCKPVCFLSIGISVVSTGIYLMQLFISPTILGRIEKSASLAELLYTIALFMGGLFLLNWLSGYFEKQVFYLYAALRMDITNEVRTKCLTTSYPNATDPEIIKLRDKSFEATAAPSRATEKIWRTMSALLTHACCFVIYLLLLSNVNLLVIVVTLITSCACFFITNRIYEWGYRHRDEFNRNWTQQCYVRGQAESVAAAKDIHIFKMKPWLTSLYQNLLDESARYTGKRESVYFRAKILDVAVAFARNGIAYAYLIWMVINHELSAAEFLLYFSAVTGFAEWVTGILKELSELRKEGLDIHAVQEYLDMEEPFLLNGGKAIPKTDQWELRLENVTFSYPNSNEKVLDKLNLTIRPGERLAIVGLNGAGKTTLVRLLCGFFDPCEGRVLLNGTDIRQFNRLEYYSLFSAVFQDFSNLDVSIAENVSQQITEIQTERVLDCLKKANLDHIEASYPDGIDTHVGRDVFLDGVIFSGGQIQRLMLARALYKDGPILILDEPTAALDPIAESDIYQKYHEMTTGKTSVFISHRLASTRFCDRIIFLSNGQIAEEGTHNELLRLNGAYANLFEIQSHYYREGVGDCE